MHVIVNTGSDSVVLRLAGTPVPLAAGGRLLVAGLAPPRAEGVNVVALSGSGMARALAHFDHVRDAVRVAGEPAPVCWPVAAALETPEIAAAWLIDLLARTPGSPEAPPGLAEGGAASPLADLLRHLARSESYGLVRFLLDEGGEHNVAALAERYGLSSAQFHRRCRQVLGRPLKRELRIQRAARTLLAYPGRARSFTYLAADHGYASLSHFCTDIKALIGCSPLSVYRAVKTPAE